MDPTRRNLLLGGSLLGTFGIGGLLPSACAILQISGKTSECRSSALRSARLGEAKPMLEEDIAPVLAASTPGMLPTCPQRNTCSIRRRRTSSSMRLSV